MEAFPLVEVKVEVEEEDGDNQRWCDNKQNDQMFKIKVEKNEEELDNADQNQLDPFSNENVQFEGFAEDFVHKGAESIVNNEDLKLYQCIQCEKRFYRSSDLNRHKNNVHKGLKSHNCDFCGKSFARSDTLKKHVLTIHEGIKKFNCNQCDKVFGYQQHLKRHIKTVHEGLKNYKCFINNVKKHFLNHLTSTDI